jgi:hypothetical protein
VARVALGDEEEAAALAALLPPLLADGGRLAAMGAAARRHVATRHDPAAAAAAVAAACAELAEREPPGDCAAAPPPASTVACRRLGGEIAVAGAAAPWPPGERRRLAVTVTNRGACRWLAARRGPGGVAFEVRVLAAEEGEQTRDTNAETAGAAAPGSATSWSGVAERRLAGAPTEPGAEGRTGVLRSRSGVSGGGRASSSAAGGGAERDLEPLRPWLALPCDLAPGDTARLALDLRRPLAPARLRIEPVVLVGYEGERVERPDDTGIEVPLS